MRRASLYSSSRRPRRLRDNAPPVFEDTSAALAAEPPVPDRISDRTAERAGSRRAGAAAKAPLGTGAAPPATAPPSRPRWQRRAALFLVPLAGVIAGAMLVLALQGGLGPQSRQVTQEDIDAAVLNTLETQQLPSPAAKAAQIIGPSVVRVQAFGPEEIDPKAPAESDTQKEKARPKPPQKDVQKDVQKEARKEGHKGAGKDEPKEVQKGVGTGVVIKDSGLILTNLHVISGAQRVTVIFADGTESEASVTGARPEHDLAVLQAATLPDDLQPATLRSTGDLREGDGVVAVGFPFDIGPSVSAGVISGFGREYRSTSGERLLTNLIQFDAAANPGSSGGPLVTMEGEVVGIVTAILNPNNQRSFVGIGFAVPIENAAAAVGIPPH